MRVLSSAFACAVLLVVSVHGASMPADPILQRLRPMHPSVRTLIEEGLARSPTFRDLARRLADSDVIAYVRLRPDMGASQGGSLRFMARGANARYVLITVNGLFARQTMVALLGHELQHAVEVAGAPEITSDETLRAYYARTGVRVRQDAYDSVAAQQAGRIVRDELAHGTPEVRMARHRQPSSGDDILLGGGESLGEMP